MVEEQVHLPWETPPSGAGASRCQWCGRDIYLPALPCSTQVVPGLAEMTTRPGFGERCKWELRTREPTCAVAEASDDAAR